MRIGYILGMKSGIHRFIFREICAMEEFGHEILIFPLKLRKSLYEPREKWTVFSNSPLRILMLQPLLALRWPRIYLNLLLRSLHTRSLADFLIGGYYAYLAEKHGVQLLHAHFGDHKLYVGYYMKGFHDLPLVVTIHAHELYANPNWRLFTRALQACEKIFAISDYNKQYLVDHLGEDPEKIQVLRLFVERRPEDKKKKILMVGSFEERKGYDDLIRAVRMLKRDDFIVWIVGKGRIDVRKIARERGVLDRFRFLGTLHSDVLDILFSACDFVILPSKSVPLRKGVDREGIPVVLMEAMSFGKPVISTRHVGIPELVTDILIDENSPEQLAQALNRLLDHPEIYAELGKKNQEIIDAKYSKRNVMELNKILRSLVRE